MKFKINDIVKILAPISDPESDPYQPRYAGQIGIVIDILDNSELHTISVRGISFEDDSYDGENFHPDELQKLKLNQLEKLMLGLKKAKVKRKKADK
jgi:hypothetical protein